MWCSKGICCCGELRGAIALGEVEVEDEWECEWGGGGGVESFIKLASDSGDLDDMINKLWILKIK